MYCSKCGALNNNNELHCKNCGNQLINSDTQNNRVENTRKESYMKKSKKVILIILAVIAVIFVVSSITMMVLNREKKSITTSDFINIMRENGYIITDKSEENDDTYKSIIVAVNYKAKFQIEFYELQSDELAEQFYIYHKSRFQRKIGSSYLTSNKEFKNYAKYTLNTDGDYMLISRIDNTAIYVNDLSENKSEIKKIIKKLGY